MSVIPSDLVVYAALGVPAYDGSSTLSATITSGASGVSFVATNAASGFPPAAGIPQEFPVLVGGQGGEIMWVTQGSSGTASGSFVVIRGFAGSAATAATGSATGGTSISMLAGGPVDMLSRLSFTDFTSNDYADTVCATASDFPLISLTARNPGGTIIYNQTAQLSGTVAVTGVGAQQYERFLYAGLGTNTTLVSAVSSVTMTTGTTTASAAQLVPFYALMGREVVNVTGGATGTTWVWQRAQLGTSATIHNVGDRIYVMPKSDVAVYMHTAIETGTCPSASSGSTGTTPSLIALQTGQGSSAGIGTIIRVTGGAGINQLRYVVANSGYGTDVVAVNRDWAPALASGSTYSVLNGLMLEVGTSTGTGASGAVQVTNIQRAFWNDSADVPGGANRNYYQKGFEINNNTVTDFTNATVQIYSDTPSLPVGANLTMALTNAAGDSGYAVNRQTAPATGGITAYAGLSVATTVVANAGGLLHGTVPNSGQSQGLWWNLSLVSGTAAYKGAADIRVQGTTT